MPFQARFMLRHAPIKFGPLLVIEQFPYIILDRFHKRPALGFHLIMQCPEPVVIIKDHLAEAGILLIRQVQSGGEHLDDLIRARGRREMSPMEAEPASHEHRTCHQPKTEKH
jgi:hypothetical protein